jgi:hypothetical protein
VYVRFLDVVALHPPVTRQESVYSVCVHRPMSSVCQSTLINSLLKCGAVVSRDVLAHRVEYAH